MFADFSAVFVLAILEMWAAIPLGFHLKLDPTMLAVATLGGSLVGVMHHAEDVNQQLGGTLRNLDERAKFQLLDPGPTVRARVFKHSDSRSDVPLRRCITDCCLGLLH